MPAGGLVNNNTWQLAGFYIEHLTGPWKFRVPGNLKVEAFQTVWGFIKHINSLNYEENFWN
jgi:hypothetical protein